MSRRLRGPAAVALTLLFLLPYPGGEARDNDDAQSHRLAVRSSTPVPASLGRTLHQHGQWRFVTVPGHESAESAIASVRERMPGAEVVAERAYDLLGPEDEPLFPDQWHHRNTGQLGGTPGADIGSLTAWQKTFGAGAIVAVVDSGVDIDHPDLASRVLTNLSWDFVDDNPDPRPSGPGPFFGHGTAVAGAIVAELNGEGVVGVAPSARIMALRACDSNICWGFDVALATFYAVDSGADVINLSLGGYGSSDPPLEAAIGYAEANGVLVVAATGNDGLDNDNLPSSLCFGFTPCLMIPSGLPNSNILAVAASTRNDGLAPFSNYGAESVDLAAPGVDIWTTMVGDTYDRVSGTSLAAPVAAGVAALMIARDSAGPQEVIARLTSFVDKKPAFSGKVASGGRISAANALTKWFIDTSESVFVGDIDWLAEQRITRGCNPPQNHQFCPGRQLTRGEMAAFMARAFALPASSIDHFDDDNGHTFEGDVNRVADAGITRGCNPPANTRFCPNRLITRGEMAAFMARAFALPASSIDHFDDDNGHTFEGDINRVADAGITRGCNPPANTRFCPDRLLTRAEMAAFIHRAMQLTN